MIKLSLVICSLICYELPSKQTLASYLVKKKEEVTGEIMCFILTDIMEAVNYLSSKEVIHKAIVPENIFVSTSNKVG
jgi:serine/threonine protein kinase